MRSSIRGSGFWLWLILFCHGPAVLGASGEFGQVKTTFVPLQAEEGVRRVYGLAADSHGRVLAANGRVWRYDGFSMEELIVPGSAPTGAVAVDAEDRVWVGNDQQFGYFARDGSGRAHFISVRDALPAANRDHGLIYAVHCVGDTVYFMAAQAVIEWRGGQFKFFPLPNVRRLFSSTLGDVCYVWQRTDFMDRRPAYLWRFVPGRKPERIASGLQDQQGMGVFADASGNLQLVANSGLIAPYSEDLTGWHGTVWDGDSLVPVTVAAVVRLPTGEIVMGSVGSGVRISDETGAVRRIIDTSDGALPDNAVEVLTVTPDGAVWGLTPRGLVRMEIATRVTYWHRAQGWTGTVNALTRWEERLYVATQIGHGFILSPRTDGRATAWQAFTQFTGGDSEFVNDWLASPTAGLVFAGQDGLWSERFQAKVGAPPWPIVHYTRETGRSAFHWDAEGNEIVYADLNGLMLWQLDRTKKGRDAWSLGWQEKRSPLDRAYPWTPRTFFATDPSGRIWFYRFNHDAGRFVPPGPPQLLTPAEGLGRVLRLERHDDRAIAYTREQAWSWGEGESAFKPLPTDAPSGQVPAALTLGADEKGWAVVLLNSQIAGDTEVRYGVFRVRFSGGRLEGLGRAPIAIVEGIGWLSSALAEPGVWWLGGTGGLARVELRAEGKELHPTVVPLLLARRDAGGAFLPLQDAPPLTGERSAAFEYTYTQATPGLPVAFQTRLSPLETGWSAPTTERQRSYTRLPGGNYEWSVRVVDAAGQAGPALTVPLAVALRPEETLWFRGLLVLAAVLAVLFSAWLWTRRLRRQRAHLEKTVGERTAALLATNEELRAKNLKRAELIGAVSHELRTPLAGAYLMAEKLAGESSAAEAENLRRCLAELRQLLEGSLDLSRYELGLIPVRLRWLNLAEHVSETVQIFSSLAASRGLALDLALPPPAAGSALFDPANLRRVLSNVISNAVKFTPQGGRIEVALDWRREGASITAAVLTVKDTGAGMNEVQRERLFSGFQRTGLRANHEAESAGFGLALTKSLVDLAGGSIHAESAPGQGTVFTIEWPMLVAPTADEPPAFFEGDILLVEDEPGHREHAVELLEPLGPTVTAAANVSEAMALAKERDFKLAWIDFNLPDGTGLELWHQLRAAGRAPTRAVLLTSHRSAAIHDIVLAAGFAAVVTKPLSVREVFEQLAAVR